MSAPTQYFGCQFEGGGWTHRRHTTHAQIHTHTAVLIIVLLLLLLQGGTAKEKSMMAVGFQQLNTFLF